MRGWRARFARGRGEAKVLRGDRMSQKRLATRCRNLRHQPTNHRRLERPGFASQLTPHPKLLLRKWAQAELELTPYSTDGGAIQVRLKQAKRVCPAEAIEPIDV